jgi:nucleotide-binding universal stress UspA family protein
MGPVLVGVDGSAGSLAALDLAADEAAARVTPLVVLHAYPRSCDDFVPACAPEWVDALTGRRRLVRTAVGRANAEHPSLAVSEELVRGEPAEALIARSARACLVVLGPPRSTVDIRVAARAAAPVLVYRPFDRAVRARPPRPVLVGVDGSAPVEPVIEFALAEAAMRGAPLVALYVWSQPAGAVPAGLHPVAYDYASARDEAARMLAEAMAGWSEKYPDVPVRHEVRHSLDVVRALSAASVGAQLVVVGRSPRSGLARLLLGSVNHAMLTGAACPVAVVP